MQPSSDCRLLQRSCLQRAARLSHLCCADCRRASHAADGPESTLPPGVAAGVVASVASVDWEVLPKPPRPPPLSPRRPPPATRCRSEGALSDTGSLAQRSSSAVKAPHSLSTPPADEPALHARSQRSDVSRNALTGRCRQAPVRTRYLIRAPDRESQYLISSRQAPVRELVLRKGSCQRLSIK
jgi:hypothetical protein